MTAVEVKNLSFAYSNGNHLLRDISFSVSEGEVFVVAGESGSGKTTLCRILCGIIPHAVKGTISGKVIVQGIDLSSESLPQIALRAGMVFQDADSQIICTTVEDEIAFGLENLCRPQDEILCRVDELLSEFGFEPLRYINPSRLSDGQKKMLTIAAVLAPAPPVLILDEPMSGLDGEGRDLVLRAIKEQRRQNRTVIIVEHDLKTAAFADTWLLLHGGTTVMSGAPADIMQDKETLIKLGVWA